MAEYHVIDPLGIDDGPLHQRLDNDGAQILHLERPQRAAKATDGRSQGGNNCRASQICDLLKPARRDEALTRRAILSPAPSIHVRRQNGLRAIT
jgi:hypothetical protein